MENKGILRVGVVVNTTMKPSRDVLLDIAQGLYGRVVDGRHVILSFFLGSAGSKLDNLLAFASAGMHALIFNGLSRAMLFRFLAAMPDHPPVVLATYSPLSEDEWRALGNGGVVILDNRSIGRRAADFFLSRGLSNFAMMSRAGYREDVAGHIRRDAFLARLQEALGPHLNYTDKTIGVFDENEDYWEMDQEEAMRWVAALPHPCGVFVNGDHLAFRVAAACRRLGVGVPDQVEILGIDNNDGFCDRAVPAVSRIVPNIAAFAEKTLELALALAADPALPRVRRFAKVVSDELIERGSTALGRGYGHVAVRAKEFIRANASRGIRVKDVAEALGVSRRTLEVRVRESTGRSVHTLIDDVKMGEVCRLLATTDLPVFDVVTRAAYSPTRHIFAKFKSRCGMTMTAYREKARQK